MATVTLPEESVTYKILAPDSGWPANVPEDLKRMLRPIAETLAMLDGNAFFSLKTVDGKEWYEDYLPEAFVLWENNGGLLGWAGEAHWVHMYEHENAEVKAAFENWHMLKRMYARNA